GPGEAIEIVIRQEAIGLDPRGGTADVLGGTIVLRSFSGARVQYVVRLADGIELVAETPSHGALAALEAGASVTLDIPPAAVLAMPVEEGPA
ncbi:TOBE domain-containing protein, partial [Salmonella enterica]|uniref:TOBE domain-containing protein n=1 Tax=Salmonella enterica TaxID=28901 RepID=UPI003D2A38E8